MLFTLLLLTGCVSMKQEIWLHGDGSGTVLMEIAIEMNAPSGMEHPFAAVEGLDQVDPNLRNIKLGERRDGESVHYTLEFDVLDWRAFATAPHKDLFPVELVQLDNGNWRWTQQVVREPNPKRAEDEMFYAGEFFDITIHAPNVVSTDGEIIATSGPQNTVHWRIPVTDMLIHGTDSVQTIEFTSFTQTATQTTTQTADDTSTNRATTGATTTEDAAPDAAETNSAFAVVTAYEPTFTETFDSYNGRWTSVDLDDRNMRLARGLYELTLNAPDLVTWQAGEIIASDFVVGVDTVFLDGPDSGGADILFRYEDESNFYELSLFADGRYGLYALVNGEWETLIKSAPSDAIRTGNNARNHVEIFAQGSTIAAAVNGVQLFVHEDSLFAAGDIALGLFTNDEAGMKVGVETLQLWNLHSLGLGSDIELSKNSGEVSITSTEPTIDDLLAQGDEFYWRGYYDLALEIFNQILEQAPDHIGALAYRGLTFAMVDEHRKAANDIGRALELDGDFPLAWHAQALLYGMDGNSIQGLRSANRAIELDPLYPNVYLVRSVIYAMEGDPTRALADLNRAIELDPDNEAFYSARGKFLHNQGDYFAALGDYFTALDLYPESPAVYLNMGDTYYEREEYWESLASFNRAISLNDGNPDGYIGRADVLRIAFEEYEAAITSYTEALALDPQNANVYFSRGMTHNAQRDFFAALDDFEQALAINPNYADVYLFRGDLYKQLTQIPAAYADYQRYLELDQSRSEYARYACEQVNALQPLAAVTSGDILGTIFGAIAPPVCNRF